MKTLRKIVLFALIGTLFVTCKKEQLPPNTVGQTVFSFAGTINSNSVSWQAGINNYYMYSSYTQNDSVYSFIGTLRSTSTNNNSIQFIINDYKVSASNATLSSSHIDSSLSSSNTYLYYKGVGTIDTTYSISFTPVIYAGAAQAYTYLFGDGGTSSAASPTHVYTESGTYNTSLTVGFSSGSITMTNPITILKNQPQFWVDSIHSALGAIAGDTAQVAFKAYESYGTSPYTYSWNFGDGNTSSIVSGGDSNFLTHTYDSTGTFPVSLTVKDNSGKIQYYTYNVIDTISSSNRMDYHMSIPKQKIDSNSHAFSDVTINYTDGGGNVYTTVNSLQPGSSKFQITSVSSYQINLNNQATKMLKVTFKCILYPVVSGPPPIEATNCTAIIAVAYN
jgi:PKD repeat protein